ncbi:uncharacterized protein ISCGN_031520 [Ixodes scapularis]
MDDDGRSSDRVSVALPVSSINRYIDKACETSRCLNEAEDVYYAGHVVECAVSTIFGSRATFLAFVLQTTAIAGAPHEVKITICRSEVDQASCSCKAGNFKCKHIVAVLLHINAAREFDQLSSTDQPQKWGKAQKERVMEKYEPRKMVDLPCANKVTLKETPQLQGNILERLLKNVPHRSAAKMHSETAVETAVEATWDLDASPKPASRDLTLLGSLDELRELAGNRNVGLPLEEVLRHLQESQSRKDIDDIERATRDQAKSSLWMRHRVARGRQHRAAVLRKTLPPPSVSRTQTPDLRGIATQESGVRGKAQLPAGIPDRSCNSPGLCWPLSPPGRREHLVRLQMTQCGWPQQQHSGAGGKPVDAAGGHRPEKHRRCVFVRGRPTTADSQLLL